MSRLYLAFAAFFSILFRGRLPEGAAALPAFVPPDAELLPPDEASLPGISTRSQPTPEPAPTTAPTAPAVPVAHARARAETELRTEGALTLLGLLQREGRLVDFLRESLDGYDDKAIGAAVRDIHRGCKKVLEDHLSLEPVMPGREEAPVTVPRGFDPGQIRIIGEVKGEPPFRGTLVHHGWRATDVKFPTLSEGIDRRVLAPAEVRVS